MNLSLDSGAAQYARRLAKTLTTMQRDGVEIDNYYSSHPRKSVARASRGDMHAAIVEAVEHALRKHATRQLFIK